MALSPVQVTFTGLADGSGQVPEKKRCRLIIRVALLLFFIHGEKSGQDVESILLCQFSQGFPHII